jgi:hypothetical protein
MVESVLEAAERHRRERDAATERKATLRSGRGFDLASREVRTIFDETERLVKAVAGLATIEVKRNRVIRLYRAGHTAALKWENPGWAQ